MTSQNNKLDQPTFKRIGLMGRAGKASVITTIEQIISQIYQLDLEPVLDDVTAKLPDITKRPTIAGKSLTDIATVERDHLGEVCDLVIVVGGDGSILHAGRVLAKHDVPVLGVNRGRLGFLADVNPDEVYQKLSQILCGEYKIDKRFLLSMQIKNEYNQVIHEAMALNDIVLHAGKSVHMIDFEMSIDGHYVYRQHSDGLIIATPTGSTAYALSAGGPIVYPNIDTIALVPMHPHTLSSRPIVVGGHSEISIQIHDDNRTQPMISADGQTGIPIEKNHSLHIAKHPHKLMLIHPPGYDFYAACRTKLGWNVKQENAINSIE